MKHWIFAACLACLGSAARAGGYLETIVQDPSHPSLSAQMLYTPKLAPAGGVTDAAVVYHQADPHDTLWPQSWIEAGVPALSWTLLEVGGGGSLHGGFVHFGASINVAPTLLGPLTGALRRAGGNYALAADLLAAPDGSGLKASFGWKANVVDGGGLKRLDDITAPPVFGIGYTYKFKPRSK